MKRLFLVLFLFVFFITPSFAHTLKTDGTIGAVIHINPEDDPIAGEESSFFFDFKDTDGKFAPKDCDCTFSVLENGNEIHAEKMFEQNADPSLENSSVYYTFPKRGIYVVRVSGTPKVSDAFQPFTLNFDVRVERESEGLQNSPNQEPQSVTEEATIKNSNTIVYGYVLLGIVGLCVIGSILYQKFARKDKD